MSSSTPQKLRSLREAFSTKQNVEVLGRYLRLPSMGRFSVPNHSLANDAVLVVLHRKWLEYAPHSLTEIGIATFDRRQVNGGQDAFAGPHAEDLLKHVWFMHLRLKSHAHLSSSEGDSKNFHFGKSIFVSQEEALNMLHQIWHQPMDEANLDRGLRPVICLTFGDNPSLSRMRRNFDSDPSTQTANVAMLDAQVIASQAQITSQRYPLLEHLLEQFRITPYGIGNSGNDAAYIMITAMLSTLRNDLYYESNSNPQSNPGQYGQSSSKPAQDVVDMLMDRPTPAPPFGIETYCHRCGSETHFFADCPKGDFVCSKCSRSDRIWRQQNAHTHKEGLCIFRF